MTDAIGMAMGYRQERFVGHSTSDSDTVRCSGLQQLDMQTSSRNQKLKRTRITRAWGGMNQT